MGTDAAGPGGAFRPGAGSMHPGYPDPGPPLFVRRHLRPAQWIIGTFTVLFLTGLGSLGRYVTVDDGRWLPSGPGLAQFGFGIALVVAGVVWYVHGLASVVRSPSRRAGASALPPRSVRRAVRRREDVPEKYRADVLFMVDDFRIALRIWLVGPMVYVLGMSLLMNAYSDRSWTEVLVVSGGFAAADLLFIGVPLALSHRWLTRTRLHYASAA